MKETQFIKQNKEKWHSFEQILEQDFATPEQLKDVYIQITDDLSYARTFYPNRSVRVYLNSLSKNVYNRINTYKKTKKNKIISFWTDDLPQLVYESRSAFHLSFFVFVGAMLIGAFSSAMDPEFVRTILGDFYVDMTLDNIKDGDPMRVYKDSKELGMSVGITFNNLKVAFMTFLMGIFYLIGSIGVLISNGVMVGSFQYFFYEQGFLLESFLTIWMHGALEISAIVIAGAAGITMGQGLVFPGTYSRIKAFQISAKRGLKIMVGITPIFILAGFIEGYLTRHTEMPNIIRAIFILACFGFVFWYFLFYPRKKHKQGFENKTDHLKLQPENLYSFEFLKIKNSGQLFNEAFLMFVALASKVGLLIAILSLLFTLVNTSLMKVNLNEIYSFKQTSILNFITDPFFKLREIPQLFYNVNEPWLLPLNLLLFIVISFFVCLLFERRAVGIGEVDRVEPSILKELSKLIGLPIVCGLIIGLLAWGSGLLIILVPFVFPFLILWLYSTFRGENNFVMAFSEAWQMYFSNFSKVIGLSFSLWVLSAFFYTFIMASLFWFLISIVGWNLEVSQQELNYLVYAMLLFFAHFNFVLIFVLNLIGFLFAFYSLKEENEGISLERNINEISFDSKIRGIAKEI